VVQPRLTGKGLKLSALALFPFALSDLASCGATFFIALVSVLWMSAPAQHQRPLLKKRRNFHT
jgi:hypothetical protein